jgi:hypothetical protein
MKDLKIYYESDLQVDSAIEKEFNKIAKRLDLKFQGSGFNLKTGIRDIHYKRES